MAVKIRLARIGKKNAPMYRIVATESQKKRDGQFIEDLGTYDPKTGSLVRFEQERINTWLSHGAQPTDAVKKLQKKYRKSA
jgi:small subunit ribosomal protein S16